MIFSHFGICVSDLDRAKHFYVHALGFEAWGAFVAGEEVAAQHGHPAELEIHAHFLRRDGTQLELLYFAKPAHLDEHGPYPMNRPGLTHIAMLVDDLDDAMARVEAFGGTVLAETRSSYRANNGNFHDAVFCTDPDGTRIELMYLPDAGWDQAISVGRARP